MLVLHGSRAREKWLILLLRELRLLVGIRGSSRRGTYSLRMRFMVGDLELILEVAMTNLDAVLVSKAMRNCAEQNL